MSKFGVVYIAYGEPARRGMAEAYGSLIRHCDIPAAVVCDAPLPIVGPQYVIYDGGFTQAKLNLDTLSPFEYTLYLDADTRVLAGCILHGFNVLADGYDLVLSPSVNQGAALLTHSTAEDRAMTVEAVGPEPLQLQAGVMWVAKNARTAALFAAWRDEWARLRGKDQGALLRALERCPVKLWILGFDWNSRDGSIIQHLFWRAR